MEKPKPSEFIPRPDGPSTEDAQASIPSDETDSAPAPSSSTANGTRLGRTQQSTPPSDSAPPNGSTSLHGSSAPHEAWRPTVLSLDGGGIRGLSSLYIIREIMREIARLETPHGATNDPTSLPAGHTPIVQPPGIAGQEPADQQDNAEPRDQGGRINERLPRPCCYFDFIVGTSTGGLIAIMLGRLRMDINDCIREYLKLGNKIFRPHKVKPFRYMSRRFQYSPDKFIEAVEEVVTRYCGCAEAERTPSCKNHLLRQNDYKERYGASGEAQVNTTCKAAVVTMREGGGNSHGGKATDVTYLFRTYDHGVRGDAFEWESNPRILDHSTLTIVEACRATSAAPTWFPYVKLRGRKFIDGGVTDHNNPAGLAYDEATEMAHEPGELRDANKSPQVLLSVGTGRTKQPRKFGLYNLFLSGRHKLTDTEQVHRSLRNQYGRDTYWRFNVPESDPGQDRKGLNAIKLDACKKKCLPKKRNEDPPVVGAQTPIVRTLEQTAEEQTKGGYRPSEYRYTTYDDIRDNTIAYCQLRDIEGDNIPLRIRSCAEKLVAASRLRKSANFGP